MSKLKDGLDEITESLGQTFEETQNTLQLKEQIQLMRHIKNKDWMNKQIQSLQHFKLDLFRTATREIKRINQRYEESFSNALKMTDTEMKQKEARERLKEIKYQNALLVTSLANSVFKAHTQWVTRLGLQMIPGQQVEIGTLEQSNQLFNQITNVLNSQEAKDVVKVAYKDGRQFTFKSYMEMNARTTMNKEINKQQLESGAALKIAFYLCNSFANCRPSHLDFQGKVYFDENWQTFGFDEETTKKIQDAIDSRNMQSRQSVEDQEPYLSNCPNCRHEFIAVDIDDVIDMSDRELLKDNDFNVDRATEHKYQVTQQARMCERNIRNYKYDIERIKNQISNAPSGSDTSKLQNQLARKKIALNNNYDKIRSIVAKNDFVERNYDRESVNILAEDLGASISLKTRNK